MLGSGWVGQNAKPQMTTEQFLNQTEGRKGGRSGKGQGKSRGKRGKGDRAEDSGSHTGVLSLFPHLRAESLVCRLPISAAH